MFWTKRRNWKRYYGFKGRRGRSVSGAHSFKGRMRFTRDAVRDVATKALHTANYVRKMLNVEYKYHDTNVAAAISTTASVNCLTQVAQGDTESTRDGNSMKVKSVRMKYTLTGNTSSDATYVRVMMFIDKDYRGNPPTVAGGTDDSLLVTQSMTAQRDRNNMKRFIMLYDKVHSFSNNGPETYYKQFFKNFDMKSTFDGAAAGNLNSNHIWLILFSDQATDTPSGDIRVRMTFLDN